MAEQNRIIENIRKKRKLNGRINRIIAGVIRVPETSFNTTTVIKGLNNADEIDILEIIMGIEAEFEITMPDDIMGQLKTVGDFYEYVRKSTGWWDK